MTSPWVLFKQSVRLFISNFKYLLKFWLVKLLIQYPPIILVAVIAIISVWPIYNASSGDPTRFVHLIYIAVPIGLIYIVLYLWLESATLIQYSIISQSQTLPIRELFSRGWKVFGKILVTGILASLAIFGGLLLFIIPGLVFAIWFSFTTPIVVIENLSGPAALSRSKQLVKGRFWSAVKYLLAPFLIIFLATLITIAIPSKSGPLGILLRVALQIAISFAGIVNLIYSFLVYREFTK